MPLLPAKRSELTPEEGLRGASDEEDGGCGIDGSRKKLRLSKDQSAVLEDSFREHPTLNPVSNHHYYRFGLLSRFQTGFCPGFGTGTRLPGQKPLEAFVPGGRTGTKGA